MIIRGRYQVIAGVPSVVGKPDDWPEGKWDDFPLEPGDMLVVTRASASDVEQTEQDARLDRRLTGRSRTSAVVVAAEQWKRVHWHYDNYPGMPDPGDADRALRDALDALDIA